jgi:uncharacterized protein (DUF433 family)
MRLRISLAVRHTHDVGAKMSLAKSAGDGCYDAARAAALSGVPRTTIYWWARYGIVVPSVSPVREKLWSYSDLMALRVVSWLRHPKSADDGIGLPASPMPSVRKALALLDELGLDPWSPDAAAGSPLLVDRSGKIYVRVREGVLNLHRQPVLLPGDVLGLTAPFDSAGMPGPDLLFPRPHLRIVPAKVAGEPHVEHSRLTTQTIAALADRGYSVAEIAAMYSEPEEVIGEAIDLERQLAAA